MIYLSCAVAFITSALSGMGVGGGGIFTFYTVSVLGVGQVLAQGINLALFSVSSLSSGIVNIFLRKINYFSVDVLTVFGAAGCLIGMKLALLLPAEILRSIFGAFLIIGGIKAFFSKSR